MLQPTNTRALRKIRIHGEFSPHSRGCQLICTVRNTRSGCGIRMVTRPDAAVKPARPSGDPFELYGKVSVALPRLSTKRTHAVALPALLPSANTARPSPCAATTGMREIGRAHV